MRACHAWAALASLAILARGAGPEIETDLIAVGKVIATADEIILRVDGEFRMATESPHGDGTSVWIPLRVREGVLRIPRKSGKHPQGGTLYTDWGAYQKAVSGLEGREVSVRMWATQTVFRGGQVREILAEACVFGKSAEVPPPPEPPKVSLSVNGKAIPLPDDAPAGLAGKALELLASCTYRNASPGKRLDEPRRKSHVHVAFSETKTVDVKASKEPVRVREMVLTLPLSSGGIWVRTDREVIYFAKFQHALARELTQGLPAAARK